jgi:hypothetical protein
MKKIKNKKYISYKKNKKIFFIKNFIIKKEKINKIKNIFNKLLSNKKINKKINKKKSFKINIQNKILIKKVDLKNYQKNNLINKKMNKNINNQIINNIIKEEIIINEEIKNDNIINDEIINYGIEGKKKDFYDDIEKFNVKFCVFVGREKNMMILHSYVEKCLREKIIDEYHMFNFSKIMSDHNFIISEYERLKKLYKEKIFLHNSEENLLLINTKRIKINWNPFYNYISKSNKNDIIIKCDDDILFIDIYSLKKAIEDRINDKISFIIHSNCINNGVCSYYQKELFKKLTQELENYPTGGILGIIFEKPEIAYAIHNEFTNNLLCDLNNLNKYIIEDKYINTRISINFILLRGEDMIYMSNVNSDDEYQISGFIPEKLCRPNKIKGDLITSHLSYSFQEKIILNRQDIYLNYEKIKNKYIKLSEDIIKNYNLFKTNVLKPHIIILDNEIIYKIKNWFSDQNYYIKNIETNKYLSIDYEDDEFYLSDKKKTYFEIILKSKSIIEIKLGIYFLTRYNTVGKFRNEGILLKYLREEKEKEILLEYENNNIENNNLHKINLENKIFYIKFLKYNLYFSLNIKDNTKIDITTEKKNKWILEKVSNTEPFIECRRLIKNDKIYYENIKTNELYSNYYKGWSLENILW